MEYTPRDGSTPDYHTHRRVCTSPQVYYRPTRHTKDDTSNDRSSQPRPGPTPGTRFSSLTTELCGGSQSGLLPRATPQYYRGPAPMDQYQEQQLQQQQPPPQQQQQQQQAVRDNYSDNTDYSRKFLHGSDNNKRDDTSNFKEIHNANATSLPDRSEAEAIVFTYEMQFRTNYATRFTAKLANVDVDNIFPVDLDSRTLINLFIDGGVKRTMTVQMEDREYIWTVTVRPSLVCYRELASRPLEELPSGGEKWLHCFDQKFYKEGQIFVRCGYVLYDENLKNLLSSGKDAILNLSKRRPSVQRMYDTLQYCHWDVLASTILIKLFSFPLFFFSSPTKQKERLQ